MNVFHRYMQAMLILSVGAATAASQTISWDGGGDGMSWSDPLNWSGDQLPGAANDVVINAASSQVVHGAGSTTVRSVQCAVGFVLSGGVLQVTAGSSELAGAFTISGNALLTVNGAGASLSATGPTTNVFGRFTAAGGGALRLPTLTSLTVSNSQGWNVHGAGSLMEFPALTNLNITGESFLHLYVITGARLDLSKVTQFSGTVAIDSLNTGSVVDLSGLTGRWSSDPGSVSILTADGGGTILLPNVTELDQTRVLASNGGTIQMDNLRKLTRVWYLTADNSILRLTNVTSLTLSNPGVNTSWTVTGAGALLDFSRLTNLVVDNGIKVDVQAGAGARLDLSGLVQSTGALQLYAHGAGSVLDVSSLAGHWRGGNGQYRLQALALNNGSILIPQITSMDRGSLIVGNGGTITTAQMRELYDVNLNVNNASLNLSNVTSLSLSNSIGWQISGASSVINFSGLTNVTILPSAALDLRAENGGRLDLSGVRQFSGTVYINSFNPGTVVDLSGLTGRWGEDASGYLQIFLEAQSGSTILIPNVTELYRARLVARGGSTIQTDGLRKLHTVDLTADNSILRLTNVTSLTVSNPAVSPVWVAIGASGLVDLSRLTNLVVDNGNLLQVQAVTGGRVDLSGLTGSLGPLSLYSSGAGSAVDVSGLAGHWRGGTSGPNRLQAIALNGGSVLIPQITSMDPGGLTLIDGGQITTAQFQDLSRVTLHAQNASLILTNVTSLVVTSAISWYISGPTNVLNLSGLTNITALPSGYLDLRAENGGRLDLSGVRQFSGTVYINSFNPGTVVDLSGLTGRWGEDASGYPLIFLEAQSGSAILIPNVTELYRARVIARGGSTIQTDALRELHAVDLTADNSILRLTNVTSVVVSNSNPIWAAYGAGALVDFSRLTNLVVAQSYVVQVQAYTGGRVDLSRLDNLFSGAVQVIASGAGSVVDLSSLSGFVNRFNTPAAFLTAETGGNILLSGDAFLLANVRVNISDHPVLPPISTPSAALTLYGRAWHSYRIESRLLNDANAPWTLFRRVPLTNSFLVLAAVTPTNQAFRVEEFVADPPIVELHRAPGQMVQLTLFGGTNKTYQIEWATNLNSVVTWEPGGTVAMTNAFRIFAPAPAPETSRFFRARQANP